MSWAPIGHGGMDKGTTLAPLALYPHRKEYEQFLTVVDDMSSDPRTLDLVAALVLNHKPERIAEVGTYRGLGTLVLAEIVRTFALGSHIWTCDPQNYEVGELLEKAEVRDFVSIVHGTFEDLLHTVFPLDFIYLDASSKEQPNLRFQYWVMALESLRPGGVLVMDDANGDWPGAEYCRRWTNRNGLYLTGGRGTIIVQT